MITLGIGIGAVIVIAIIWVVTTTNKFKALNLKVEESLSGIEVSLTKRYDMLKKMTAVVKQYIEHENSIFTKVIELRKGMNVNELEKANKEIDGLQKQLFAVAENYPELRSSEAVVVLEKGIVDAEDDLQASRRIYNKNVNAYNTAIVMFPDSILAGSRNKLELYKADEEQKKDIDVNIL